MFNYVEKHFGGEHANKFTTTLNVEDLATEYTTLYHPTTEVKLWLNKYRLIHTHTSDGQTKSLYFLNHKIQSIYALQLINDYGPFK